MEILMQQKYIHLNLHGVYELLAELRRTRHPKLEPISCNGTEFGDKPDKDFFYLRYEEPAKP
jgi:hypothetical protein